MYAQIWIQLNLRSFVEGPGMNSGSYMTIDDIFYNF
jgi:hypothetical protein